MIQEDKNTERNKEELDEKIVMVLSENPDKKTRGKISDLLGVNTAICHKYLKKLVTEGVIKKVRGGSNGSSGRPFEYYQLMNKGNIEIPKLQQRIIKLLSKNSSMTRNKISNSLKVARSTLYYNLLKLVDRELIKKVRQASGGKAGRPFVIYSLG